MSQSGLSTSDERSDASQEARMLAFEAAWQNRRPGTPPPRWQELLPPPDQSKNR
jgi:hypothetical protein